MSTPTSFASTPVSDFRQSRGGSATIRSPSTRTPGIWRQNSSSTFSGGGSSHRRRLRDSACRSAETVTAPATASTLSIALGSPCRSIDASRNQPAGLVEPAEAVHQREGLADQFAAGAAGKRGQVQFVRQHPRGPSRANWTCPLFRAAQAGGYRPLDPRHRRQAVEVHFFLGQIDHGRHGLLLVGPDRQASVGERDRSNVHPGRPGIVLFPVCVTI